MDRLLRLTRQAERSHFWFRGFRWFVRPQLAKAAGARRDLWLLDAGCGTGANLAVLRRWGRAFGFDLTWVGVSLAHLECHAPVAQASIAAIPFGDATFDLVTSFDVLQCVPTGAQDTAMSELTRVLKPGGTLVLNVSAFDALRGRHSTLSEEIRRYTPGAVRRMVEGAGLRVTTLTCTNAVLLPPLWVRRTWERWVSGGNPPAGEADIRVPPEPLNAVLSGLLWIEQWLLRVVSLPVGSSILCVARKPPRPPV